MNLSKLKSFFNQMQDIIISGILYIIPGYVKWFYHTRIKNNIISFPLSDSAGHKGWLYLHGNEGYSKKEVVATLIIHGLCGHPCVMLQLAVMAQKVDVGPVFNLYVSYDQDQPEKYRTLIKQALDKIKKLTQERNCILKGIVMVGHSMGAIESAFCSFVEKDSRVISVISLAGRLKFVPSESAGCSDAFNSTVDRINAEIHLQPEKPLYQIAGDRDWIVSVETAIVRNDPECSHVIKGAMHLNLLYHPEMQLKFPEYLRKSAKNL